ncbi:hypothetical protein N9Y89_02165 [bacterium]|nr:hypothetical protein [bacterium]
MILVNKSSNDKFTSSNQKVDELSKKINQINRELKIIMGFYYKSLAQKPMRL